MKLPLRLWHGHFLDIHVIVFVKNDRFTISVLIILSINWWGSYHLKMCCMDNQIYILQLTTYLLFYKLWFEVKKIDVRFNKIEIKVYIDVFDNVYPTRPSDTVAKYTIYLTILLVERLFKWSWVLFCYFILCLPKSGSKISCILLCEIEYLLEFVSVNNLFYSVLPTPRFKQLLFGGGYSKDFKNLKTYVFGRLFFDMNISRSCH